MIIRAAVTFVLAVLLAGALVAAGGGTTRSAATGSPDRGRAVFYGPGGCSGCHSVSSDPNEPSTGPRLTLDSLRAHAADRGKPVGAYVAESILTPSAYATPGYVSGTMQPPHGLTTLQIEDLVSYLIGAPWTSPAGGPLPLPARPVAACNAKASCRATVARWVKAEKLPARAIPGAKIAAIAGCLSCHRYAGSGVKSAGAPDLTRAGLSKPTVAALVKRLRCPGCVKRGSVMPSYRAFGDTNLAAVAAFLRASRGVRP